MIINLLEATTHLAFISEWLLKKILKQISQFIQNERIVP